MHMLSAKRQTNRIAALATAALPPEMLVPELVIALQQAIGTDAALPAVFAHHPSDGPIDQFTVWRGAEGSIDALRALLGAGIWPAPSTIPSVQRLMTERLGCSVYAAPLWGEGCTEDGPWEPLWRERNIRHGFYLAAFAPSGRVCVALMSRAPESPAFSKSDIALGEASARYIASCIDRRPDVRATCDTLVNEIPVAFAADDSLSSLGVGGPEQLRDLCGGGPNAVALARALLESAAARFRQEVSAGAASTNADPAMPSMLGGADDETAFRQGNFRLMMNTRTRLPHTIELAHTDHGSFDLLVAASNDLQSGKLLVLGTLRRRVPRLLAVVRGLIASDAPGREMELAMQLCTGASLPEAAHVLGISTTSVRTLLSRLAGRFHTTGRDRIVEEIVKVGQAVLR